LFQADLSEDVKENSHKFEQAAIMEVYPIDFWDILGEKCFGDAMDEKKIIQLPLVSNVCVIFGSTTKQFISHNLILYY